MKIFVFDLYGTLVDIRTDESRQKFKNKYQKYLKKFGADNRFFENFYAVLAPFKDTDEPDIVQVIMQAISLSGGKISAEEGKTAALKFRRLSTRKLKLYKGVKGLLKELKEGGAKIYLLSNAQSAFTVYELKKLGIYGCFDGIELSSDFGKKKPSADFFAHLVEKYSLDVKQTVFTGNDIGCDIVPSKNAGMYAVYIKSDISPAGDKLSCARSLADFATDSVSSAYSHIVSLKSMN